MNWAPEHCILCIQSMKIMRFAHTEEQICNEICNESWNVKKVRTYEFDNLFQTVVTTGKDILERYDFGATAQLDVCVH